MVLSAEYAAEVAVRQADVLNRFLHEFQKLHPKLTFRSMRRVSNGGIGPARLQIQLQLGSNTMAALDILAIGDGDEETVLRALERFPGERPRARDLTPTLLAPQMSPAGRRACEQARVAWMDLSGGAQIETEGVYYLIDRIEPEPAPSGVRSPFLGKAERVCRALLLDPRRRWRMRELAQAAGVSLGLASMVTTALADERLLTKGRDGLELFNPGSLLERWAQAYDIHRSPFRMFRSSQPTGTLLTKLQRSLGDDATRYALTLWSAAGAYLPGELSPHRLALYWDGMPDDVASALGLGEEQGSTYVFVFKPYDVGVLGGAAVTASGIPAVHPCQLYLDLGCGDEQEIALAQRVRDQLLHW